MFACIYFHEDASLSVVGKANKKLILKGEFKRGDAVEMEWSAGKKKELYHGTIIHTGDDEESLSKIATKAYKKILKDSKKEDLPDLIADKLFDFFEKPNLESGKRQRLQTERLKESKEQDETHSPKKKKSGDIVSKKPAEINKKKETL